jgi:hypothetical protein
VSAIVRRCSLVGAPTASAWAGRRGWQHVGAMEAGERVCPFCGEPPGTGVFCAACGRNLAAVERLPTRGEWEARVEGTRPPAGGDGALAERCAAATAAFLAAMRAAGCPGVTKTPRRKQALLRRAGRAEGWVVRPVDRDDDVSPRRYESGLVLTTDGDWYRLDNVVRGYGTRDFPQYEHTVGAEPIAMPVDERLPAELASVLRAQGLDAPVP